MTPEQIREVVKITIEELEKSRKLTLDCYQSILKVVDKELYNFFANKDCHKRLTWILHQLSDDQYIDIIYLQYRDRKTIEWIAGYMQKDVSTIKRNKKRIINSIYTMMEVYYE